MTLLNHRIRPIVPPSPDKKNARRSTTAPRSQEKKARSASGSASCRTAIRAGARRSAPQIPPPSACSAFRLSGAPVPPTSVCSAFRLSGALVPLTSVCSAFRLSGAPVPPTSACSAFRLSGAPVPPTSACSAFRVSGAPVPPPALAPSAFFRCSSGATLPAAPPAAEAIRPCAGSPLPGLAATNTYDPPGK